MTGISQHEDFHVQTGSYLDLEGRQALAHLAATVLLFPGRHCRIGRCRRSGTCTMSYSGGQPCCLDALPPDARAIHRALYAETVQQFERFGSRMAIEPLSPDPDVRELQEAASAIVLAAFRDDHDLSRRFLSERRSRDAAAGPVYSGGKLDWHRQFEAYMRGQLKNLEQDRNAEIDAVLKTPTATPLPAVWPRLPVRRKTPPRSLPAPPPDASRRKTGSGDSDARRESPETGRPCGE